MKGFARVELEPSETKHVRIDLGQRAFSFWSERFKRWVVEAGEFIVEAGHHSRDLPLSAVVHIEAPPLRPPLTADSTLGEWISDPNGRELLAGTAADALLDPELIKITGNMPMSTLAGFGRAAPDYDTLDRLVAQWRERTGTAAY